MCLDPVSMMVIGAGVSAGGQLYSGIAADKAARRDASRLETQAALAQGKGEYEAEQAFRRFERDKGKKEAAVGTTGIDIQSFADVFADDSEEAALERKTIRQNAMADADNLRYRASSTRQAGKNAMIGSAFAAVGSVFGAAGKARLPNSSSTY